MKIFEQKNGRKMFGKYSSRDISKIVYPNWRDKLRNAYSNPRETNIYKALKNIKKEDIVHLEKGNVTIVKLSEKIEINTPNSDLLYIRDFYPSFLEDVRGTWRSIIIGNPGISKSMFQYYYLARIFNPSFFGSLPPNCYGSTMPPEVVVRQLCGDSFEFYEQNSDEVVAVDEKDFSTMILKFMDPEKSLYLMEPGFELQRPLPTDIPTCITVSPDTSRYKEFQKQGGEFFYMPTYDEEELLSIGEYLISENRIPVGMEKEYTIESIKNRIHTFGGIIRHVFPRSHKKLEDTYALQENAMRSACTPNETKKLLASVSIEDNRVSHLIAQYVVPRKTENGKIRFRRYRLDFVSENIKNRLQEAIENVDLSDSILTLIRNDETNHMETLCPLVYENVVSRMMVSTFGLEGEIKEKKFPTVTLVPKQDTSAPTTVQINDQWIGAKFKVDNMVRGSFPSYEEMKPNTLYHPTNPNFPVVEFFYKDDQGKMIAFQVTRQSSTNKILTRSEFNKFMKKINFPMNEIDSKFELILIPRPDLAEKMILDSDERMPMKKYSVFKFSEKYNHQKFRGL